MSLRQPIVAGNVPDSQYTSLVFIDILEPSDSKDHRKTRTARSHAVRVALARKRRSAQQLGDNFRAFSTSTKAHPQPAAHAINTAMIKAIVPSGYLGQASIDPFETLPVDARRLTTLFHLKRSMSAGEPVFNANDAIHFQSLHSVFQTGLTDGALTAALSLTMCYSANGGSFNDECTNLSSIALQQVRKKLSDCNAAVTPSTFGSILLLLGIEYRMGAHQRARAHLDGIRVLLDLCTKQNVSLPVPLRRAIYWQDLFSSIFVQTARIVDYRNFHPGDHSPKLCLTSFRNIPDGFARKSTRLGLQFMCIVSDVAALYHHRTEWLAMNRQEQGLERLCNTQADLEGRLQDLRQSTSDHLLVSCAIAAFLCVYGFWTAVWESALIPRGLSTQLLHHMRCWQRIEPWHDDDLLFWLVHIGKAFAIDAHVRHGLDEIRKGRKNSVPDLPIGGLQAKTILSSFIWSDLFYQSETGWFWERIDETG